MQVNRHHIFGDRDFWLVLEFRLSGDFQASKLGSMRRYWIDGFLPSELKNTKQGAVVFGHVWMAEHGSGKQEQWSFQVDIPQNMLHKSVRKFEYRIKVFDETKMMLALEISKQQECPTS